MFMNIPGTRSPTLRPYWHCQAQDESLLSDDRMADRYDGMDQLATQALALGGEGAFLVCQSLPRR
jgi:hypothetical protein